MEFIIFLVTVMIGMEVIVLCGIAMEIKKIGEILKNIIQHSKSN